MQKFKTDFPSIIIALFFTIIACTVANMIGYESLGNSLPGILVLSAITLGGYFLSYVVPLKKVSAVLWISIIAILISSPISPISDFVVTSVDSLNINAIITPILAYAGVIIGKDWGAFKSVGIKGAVSYTHLTLPTILLV